jgi:hypothetical protein
MKPVAIMPQRTGLGDVLDMMVEASVSEMGNFEAEQSFTVTIRLIGKNLTDLIQILTYLFDEVITG